MWQPGPTATLQKNTVYSYTHQKNGLTVLLCPVSGSSVTAYMRAVNAGSKDEAAVTPMGAAHFIEHMSFRIQNGKIWSISVLHSGQYKTRVLSTWVVLDLFV